MQRAIIEQIEKRKLEEEFGVKQPQQYSELDPGVLKEDEISINDIQEVLGKTIKKDDFNKTLVFLSQLLTYTFDSQINVSFNAPSSSGKSYLALEVAELFPKEDVLKLGYASPTSFFHTTSQFDKEKNCYVVDLERKIVIFLDMPHPQLLGNLRPLLSHDQKEILVKVTDKSKRGSIKTKDIIIKGYPCVLFCSASFKFDEQELTRFILLSPETSQEKFREAIFEKVRKETDRTAYLRELEEDPKRQMIKVRIEAIKMANVNEIGIGTPDKLLAMFYERNKILKPRHSRDIQRITSLTKAFALLNLWNRESKDGVILTSEADLLNAFKIWDEISISQDLGVPPYILNLYKEVIIPAFDENNEVGISRQRLIKKHYEVYGRHLADWQLRQEILPMLEVAGLIIQDENPLNKREKLIYPQLPLTISQHQADMKPESQLSLEEDRDE